MSTGPDMLSAIADTAMRALFFFGFVALLFAPLEWASAHVRTNDKVNGRTRRKATDVLHYLINPLVVHPLAATLLIGWTWLVDLEPSAGAIAHWPIAVQAILVFGLGEFFGYMLHRALHEVPWLWRFHRVHHSAEKLDWLAAHRQHPLETTMFLLCLNVPAIALGFDFDTVVTVVVLQKLHAVFVHARLSIRIPFVEQVLALPAFHRRHHQRHGAAKNFASLSPLFDRLFGTYAAPDADCAVGLPHDEARFVPENYFGQLASPWRQAHQPERRVPGPS